MMEVLSPGEVIAQRYQVERFLGQGAMGAVYLVTHMDLMNTFALKLLLPQYSFDDNYRVRFKREAQINAQLKHPNVVQVYDTGEHKGLLYTVMELLSGDDMRGFILDDRITTVEEIVTVGLQIAEALDAAHSIGLVHRDLKPANVMIEVDREGVWRCILVDFGLAFIQESEQLGRMTATNAGVAGTPLYMSPEQVSGKTLTGASDLYAFGCLLYELVEGHTPFECEEDDVVKVMTRQLFSPAPAMQKIAERRIPVGLENLILRLLEKDVARRPTSAEAVATLRDLLASSSQWGRGGDMMSRAARMVHPATERKVIDSQVTARFERERHIQRSAFDGDVIGWIGDLDMDLLVAMASNGYQLLTFDDELECDVIFGSNLTPAEVSTLSETHAVIAALDPSDIEGAALMVRAGAVDVIPPDFTPDELTRRVKRALRRARRKKK